MSLRNLNREEELTVYRLLLLLKKRSRWISIRRHRCPVWGRWLPHTRDEAREALKTLPLFFQESVSMDEADSAITLKSLWRLQQWPSTKPDECAVNIMLLAQFEL